MANCDNWDIPDPGCFESCPPETCGPCDAGNIFKHPHKLPGVPVGRVTVPLVRVNGQIQDLNAGGYIGNQFLEPPHMSWDPQEGILNIGGRFIKLTGMAMSYSDCHGMPVTPCTPLMTCKNFADIINASTGLGFKDPNNPFAGLTIFLAPNSGLIVNNNGLKIDAAAVCQMLKDIGCSLGTAPIPNPPAPNPDPNPDPGPGPSPNPDPGPNPNPGPGPSPNPTPTPEVLTRSGIGGYQCHNSGNTQLQNMTGTATITWTETSAGSGIGSVSVSPSGFSLGYSGSASAASLIWAGGTIPKSTFNAISIVAADSICSAPPSPDPDPGPGPSPDPTPDTSPKSVPNSGCNGGSSVDLSWSAGTVSVTMTITGAIYADCSFTGVGLPSFQVGCNFGGLPGVPATYTASCSDTQYAAITGTSVSNCQSCN